MRSSFAAIFILCASFLSTPSQADPYLWCAVTGSQGNELCKFKTLEQCRSAISSLGGACTPNLGYDRRDATYGRRHHALRY